MPLVSGQITGGTAVNLSRLPFPAVVEALDYASILAALKASLIADMPSLAGALEMASDPLTRLVQLFAYRELILRGRINDGAKALMVAYAVGADLDNLVALFGVSRLELTPADPETGADAIMESDADLRRRAILAPEGYSVAGPAGAYVFHALSAHPDVADVSVTSPSPGVVRVAVLSREAGGAPSDEVLDAVEARLNDDEIRPLTDQVEIQAAEILDFTVAAELALYSGPDPTLVQAEAQARLQAYLADSFRMGRTVAVSGLMAALHAEGVASVTLTQPAADVSAGPLQAAYCTDVSLDAA